MRNIDIELGQAFCARLPMSKANTQIKIEYNAQDTATMYLYHSCIAKVDNHALYIKRVSINGRVSRTTTSRIQGVLAQFHNTKHITATDLRKMPVDKWLKMRV